MEIGLSVPLQAEVLKPGSAVLPARLLLDVVRSLAGEHADDGAEERGAGRRVDLRREHFPPAHARAARTSRRCRRRTPETRIALPPEAFVQTVSRVARSASRDETRPVLTGILMSASGQELRMVATDSYRLSVKETQLAEPLQGSLEANVPARALQELVRIAQQAPAARSLCGERQPEPGDLRARRRSCSPRA